jgi:hypothetical protein
MDVQPTLDRQVMFVSFFPTKILLFHFFAFSLLTTELCFYIDKDK